MPINFENIIPKDFSDIHLQDWIPDAVLEIDPKIVAFVGLTALCAFGLGWITHKPAPLQEKELDKDEKIPGQTYTIDQKNFKLVIQKTKKIISADITYKENGNNSKINQSLKTIPRDILDQSDKIIHEWALNLIKYITDKKEKKEFSIRTSNQRWNTGQFVVKYTLTSRAIEPLSNSKFAPDIKNRFAKKAAEKQEKIKKDQFTSVIKVLKNLSTLNIFGSDDFNMKTTRI